jgi:hypothetical protein
MQLVGLYWAGAEAPRKRIDALLAGQRSDGEWAQRTGFPSDAYATGEALYALNQAGGVPIRHPAFAGVWSI